MKYNRWVVALGLVLCCVLVGCGSDDGTKASDIEGTWRLSELAGISSTTGLFSGTLNLDDGRYTFTVSSFGVSESDSGSYKLSGSSITFTSSDGSSFTGTLSDGNKKITMSEEGITLVFTKS